MKLFKETHILGDGLKRRENGHPEVISAGFLAEPGSGDDAQPGFLQKGETVKGVRGFTVRLGGLDSLGRQLDRGKSVHGAHDGIARYARDRIEGFGDQLGLGLERVQNGRLFLDEQVVRGFARLWLVAHDGHGTLAHGGRAQFRRN